MVYLPRPRFPLWVRGFAWAGVALVGGLGSAARPVARAQFRDQNRLVTTPGVSLAAPDSAYAVDLNPAALGFLSSWSLRYVHAQAAEDDTVATQGDALSFATPLLFGTALGLSGQSVRPSEATGLGDRGAVALALAYAPNRLVSVGGSARFYGSFDDSVDNIVSVDAALALRPSSRLAISLLFYDVFGPLDLSGSSSTRVEMNTVLAAALRPWGDDRFTVEGAAGVDTDGRTGVRVMGEIAVPRIGRLQASGEFADLGGTQEEMRAIAGIALDLGRIGVTGGVLVGDGVGKAGWYLGGRLDGAPRRPALFDGAFALDLRLAGELDPRGIVALTLRLEQARQNRRVKAVLLRLRGSSMSLAAAQELRMMIERLRAAGKPVTCHLDSASGAEFYACAATGATAVDPAGGIRFAGLSSSALFFGELLGNVGVHADFVRAGQFKSSPEQWMRSDASKPARYARDVLLDDYYGRLVFDLSKDLRRSETEIRALIDRGPFTATEAMSEGMVGRLRGGESIAADLRSEDGRSLYVREALPPEQPRHWGVPDRVGVVVVDGTIVDGDNVDVPFVDIHLSGSRTVVQTIQDFARDPSIRAIVLRVDSPGGSALASDQVWRAVREARRSKPVVASLGSVAASGGYYIASAASEIWANPSTLTGSIGVFYGKVDFEGLANKLGIGIEHFKRGRYAGFTSPWRPFTAEEREMVSQKVQSFYQLFLQRVGEGRGMSSARVDRVAQGRVWSGERAKKAGLIDHLGGLDAALRRARALASLPSTAPTVVRPNRPETLVDYVLGANESRRVKGRRGRQRNRDLLRSTEASLGRFTGPWREAATMASAMALSREGSPMAMIPYTIHVQ